MGTKTDFTPTGLKIEGAYENDRNGESSDLFKAIIREVYGVKDVLCGHHLVYEAEEVRDGFTFQVIEEIPSADTLIFDHDCAKRLWGITWEQNLVTLALTPPEHRDAKLAELYYGRERNV